MPNAAVGPGVHGRVERLLAWVAAAVAAGAFYALVTGSVPGL
jgi:hypothetical protein